MSDITAAPRAPWHHWPMAVIALAFYGVAALDYTLAKLGVAAYLRLFSPEQQQFVRDMAGWLSAVWAMGAWGGLLGAWLLFNRRRGAVLFLFGAAGVVGFLTIWLSLFTRPTIFGLAGFTGFYVMIGSTAIAVLIYLYARWERSEKALI